MMGAETSYYPGGSQTRASTGPVAGIDPASMDLLNRVLQKRLQGALAEPSPGAAGRSRSPLGASEGYSAPAPRRQATEGYIGRDPRPSKHEMDDEFAERAARRAQLNAAASPPPMRMVTGPGIIPGYTMDVNAMNAYQRQLYLPKDAGVAREGLTPDQYSELEERRAQARATEGGREQDVERQRNQPTSALNQEEARREARRRSILELYGREVLAAMIQQGQA